MHWAADPRVLFTAIALALLGVIWSTTYSLIDLERTSAQRAGAVSSRELLDTYEAQVVRALGEIDQASNLVRYAYESGAAAPLTELSRRGLLPSELVFTVSATDRSGDVIASTRPSAQANVAAEDYFKSQVADDVDTMSIGSSRQAPAARHELLFSRRWLARDGRFGGIVMVAVDPAYFVSGYDEAKLGARGVLALLGTDGVFRVRRTGESISMGDSIDYSSVVSNEDDADSAARIAASPWDGVRRFTSARELFEFPLAVVVGLAEDELLAAARGQTRVYLQRAALGSAFIVLLCAWLGRMSWHLAQGRRREGEAKIEHAARVEYLAYHDGLTGLPNRSLFSRLLSQAIAQAHRHDRQLAVAFLDLDRFKQINDTLGHEAGDDLLKEVAARLTACVRDSDTVARLGGDEFVVLLPELTDAQYAANVARKILATVAKPFMLIGQEFRVTASIGICNYPQDGQDEQTLTKNADIAMYKAKEEGKNNFQFYSEKLNANSLERLTLESSLRHALERNEFRLYYQAKREIATGHVTGMEALLRWEHPDFGVLEPMRFMAVAEDTGMIVPIGKWVIHTACLQNVAWQKAGLPSLKIAINLSARQFADESLLQDIAVILKTTGMDAALLELELAEGILMHDVEKALTILTGLKALGVKIAIDDFGTGYSSLATLQRFPLDTIKIDRSFMRALASTDADDHLTDAVIAMGRALSLTVVAQGVETREQAEFLRDHACDELQGFYFARPVAAEQATQLLRAQSPEVTYIGSRAALRDAR